MKFTFSLIVAVFVLSAATAMFASAEDRYFTYSKSSGSYTTPNVYCGNTNSQAYFKMRCVFTKGGLTKADSASSNFTNNKSCTGIWSEVGLYNSSGLYAQNVGETSSSVTGSLWVATSKVEHQQHAGTNARKVNGVWRVDDIGYATVTGN